MAHRRQELARSNPEIKNVYKVVGPEWKELDESSKEEWNAKAKAVRGASSSEVSSALPVVAEVAPLAPPVASSSKKTKSHRAESSSSAAPSAPKTEHVEREHKSRTKSNKRRVVDTA